MKIFDDQRVPPRTLEEIEAEAGRCRSRAELDQDGRIDLIQLLRAWKITLEVKSDAKMGDNEAYSLAKEQKICCRRSISQGLRFGDPHARYAIGHELGHMFLHRGCAPKPLKLEGNNSPAFVRAEDSAERQAWMFARALFVTRLDLASGETDADLGIRLGIGTGPVALRRKEVRRAVSERIPKRVPDEVVAFLEAAKRAQKREKSQCAGRQEVLAAWSRAECIPGEDPEVARSARGFRVEWTHRERWDSQVGWTIVQGEVISFLDLKSR